MIDPLLQRDPAPYRRIGELSVSHAMARAGIGHTAEGACIERLTCFLEVPAALYKLAALWLYTLAVRRIARIESSCRPKSDITSALISRRSRDSV